MSKINQKCSCGHNRLKHKEGGKFVTMYCEGRLKPCNCTEFRRLV